MHVRFRSPRSAILGTALASLALASFGIAQQPPPRRPGRQQPQPPAAPRPPRIVHPEPSLRHATPRYEADFPAGESIRAFYDLLERPIAGNRLELDEAPLRDVQQWIAKASGMSAEIDHRRLEDAGLDADVPCTTLVARGSFADAFKQVLDPLELEVIPDRGRLLITTRERAEDTPVVGLYPLPLGCTDLGALIDLIQSSVAADTWDTVGGPGSIRPHDDLQQLVISHSIIAHRDILALMRSLDAFDPGGTAADGAGKPLPGRAPARVHELRNPALADELAGKLVDLCNAALGPQADPDARISVVAGRLVIQSASRPFQVYAGQLIRSFDGVEQRSKPDGGPGFGF